MKPNEYQCAHCKNIYKKGVSDEECEKECKEIWGGTSDEIDGTLVCDDCWKLMKPRKLPSQQAMDKAIAMADDLENYKCACGCYWLDPEKEWCDKCPKK